ncbi:AsmA family protein [Brucella vulpis]|nr:AsmA family protein [Brucella vulpis]
MRCRDLGRGFAAELTSDFQFAKGILRFPNLVGTLNGDNISARIEANFADSGFAAA